MNLPPEKWEEVKALFEAALDETPETRPAFLAEKCLDEDVRREAERLLQNHGEMGGFLTDPVLAEGPLAEDTLAPPTFSAGDVVASRFRVTRFIARGGMGEVYAAEDLQLGGEVAIKTVRPELLLECGAVERFKREVQVAKQVTHPNVCRIYDLFVSSVSERGGVGPGGEGLFFVSMELLPGETLAQRLKRSGRMPAAEALQIAAQVASGVGAAHQAGVLHRDLKPGNILLVPSGRPEGVRAVVTDFGLARSSTADPHALATSPNRPSLSGTPAYMSPEQLQGKQVTPASDVYALGLVMYEMAAGSPAFPTLFRDPREIPRPPRSLAPGLSRRWEAVILKCLESEPSRRFQSAAEVNAALSPETRVPRWKLRGGVLVALSIFALLAVATLGWMGVRLRTSLRKTTTETSIAPARRRSVAVLGFKNATVRADAAWISTALSEMLTTELAAGGQLRTIPEESVTRTKADLSLPDSESYGRQTLARIRQNLGSDFVVVGAYFDLGKGTAGPVRLDLRLQDTVTGETVAAVSESGTEASLVDLVLRAGARLRNKLGVEQASAIEANAIRASLPANPEAARFYAEGLERLRMYDALGARGLLEKAIAAQPGYAMAHSTMAGAWSALGYDEKAKEEGKKGFDLSGSLSREDRLSVEARYREMTHEWDRAVELYRALFTFFPDNLDYGLRMANAEVAGGKGKDALLVVEALRKLPSPAGDDPRIDLAEAGAAFKLADFKREEAAAARAAEKAKKIGASLLVAAAQLQQCQCWAFGNPGQYKKAPTACEAARNTFASAGNRDGVAKALLPFGVGLYFEGDMAGAQSAYEQALAAYNEVGDQSGIAVSLNNIADILSRQGDHAGAEAHFEQCLAISREVDYKNGVGLALGNMGSELMLMGNLSEAAARFRQSLEVARDIGQQYMEPADLDGLGNTLCIQGDLVRSEKMLEESLETCRRIDLKDSCGAALLHLGDLLVWEGKLDRAKAEYQEAVDIRNQLGNQIEAAQSQLSMAELSMEEGRARDAEAPVREARNVFRKQRLVEDEVQADAILARAYLVQGKCAEAQGEVDGATALVAKVQNREVRLKLAIVAASVGAASGGSTSLAEAARGLRATLAEATKYGYVPYQLEARLALCEVEMHSGHAAEGRARLASLEKDAEAKGFGLIARKAATDLALRH